MTKAAGVQRIEEPDFDEFTPDFIALHAQLEASARDKVSRVPQSKDEVEHLRAAYTAVLSDILATG